ncbi:MAG: formate dehydrogenase accessory protein FdhE [Desulfomonilaceae bacterium]
MTEQRSAQQASERVQKAIERMREDLPQLAAVFDAFKGLLAAQSALKTELPPINRNDLSIDPIQYSQGVPLLAGDAFTLSTDDLRRASECLMAAMEKGFPKIKKQLIIIKKAIESKNQDSGLCLTAIGACADEEIDRTASKLGVDMGILQFVLGQLAKPFAQKQAESLAPLPQDLQWHKGYCPVCGSWPEMSFLEGKEGRRRLRCSFCAHEWSYMRTKCPFCESEDQEKLELLFSEDRRSERAELCYECMKYLVSLDLRERFDDVVREAAPLGLVYLDVLAQDKGFAPGAICGWNVIDQG